MFGNYYLGTTLAGNGEEEARPSANKTWRECIDKEFSDYHLGLLQILLKMYVRAAIFTAVELDDAEELSMVAWQSIL